MTRTSIDIDDELMAGVQPRYGFRTKREAVDFALRRLILEPFTREEALAAQGSGRGGDLDEMRAATAAHSAPSTSRRSSASWPIMVLTSRGSASSWQRLGCASSR